MEDLANSGAMIAMGAGMVLGSPNEAHRHTMEDGDHATRNMTIITMDICNDSRRLNANRHFGKKSGLFLYCSSVASLHFTV